MEEFKNIHLWEIQDRRFACTGHARQLLEAAKKKLGISGRIFEVFSGNELKHLDVSHSYVVLDGQQDNELALNQGLNKPPITVGEVKQGNDITEEILNADWKELR